MSFLGAIGLEKRPAGVLARQRAVWAGADDTYFPSTPNAFDENGNVFTPVAPPRRRCANPLCSAGWSKRWRNKRRPIFEGQWACGSECLEMMVRVAAGRELGDGISAWEHPPHRHRLPLGLVMLEQGWITHPQLRRALAAQRKAGTGRIGEWLQHECGISANLITLALSLQWNCPVLPVHGFTPRAMALVMPRVFVEEFKLLPLRMEGSRRLYMGFRDRLDASAAFSLEQMSELQVESGLVENHAFAKAHERLLDCAYIDTARETVRDTEELARQVAQTLAERQPIASRLVRMHRFYWLRMWLETGARSGAGTVPVTSEDVFDTVFQVGHEN